ncbi:hypothetical protein EL17_06840 [Anditalea andensis]|uniref:Diphthamide synthase domain-containing protein n=2 Tax=Anditalea andensis TaxID=1048983 RepID=A0A074LKS8_9BACT|nr:hypothetical protein [Anditalea andensis]KEO74447.1 hypothetical protein EL17_06840 [Anditalea andensis]
MYREEQLATKGFKAVFTIKKNENSDLAVEFIDQGFKTIICAADADKRGDKWVGHDFNHRFLDVLPDSVDPCGKNGEFHSF